MSMTTRISRRSALRRIAAGAAIAPFFIRDGAQAAALEVVNHAGFGANGMGLADIRSLAGSKFLKLVAVAEVDAERATSVKKLFPDVKVYSDWRELLEKEKNLHSASISTPDHMHAPITMRCMQQGLHVYTQKPLTQTVYESRRLREVAAEKKLVSQMGIQIHSHEVHRTVVATIQAGAIGKVKEVHSWSGKQWGDRAAKPDRKDPVPAGLNWDGWLGVAAERPFIGGSYYHPGNWRKRLDFGTGTFGDMACHILDPVFTSLALTAPKSVRSEDEAPNAYSWSLNVKVQYVFPGTKFTTESVAIHWYNGNNRPPNEITALIGSRKLNDQGSIYVGTDGVLYSPYIGPLVLLPEDKFKDYKGPKLGGENHYNQFVEAVRGNAKTSAAFDFAGPMTESVLLGCLSTRFARTTLEWDAATMKVTNVADANKFVRRQYRKGWEVEGL
jgi:predicted dehydrogenase